MYEEQYYDHAASENPEQLVRRRLLENPREMERFEATVSVIPKDAKSLLDVGCGFGVLLKLLQERRPGMRAIGIERSWPAVATGQQMFGVPILRGSIDSLPFADGEFDVVTACEVLEHLPYDVYAKSLRELQRVAHSTIVVTVPHEERRDLARCPYCKCRFDPFYHMREFDDRALKELFDAFLLEKIVPIGLETVPLMLSFRLWLRDVRGRSGFPTYGICPQCGFRNARPPVANDESAAESSGARLWMRRLTAWIPRKRRPHWAVAVYHRSPLNRVACDCRG